jgi:membrane protein
MAIPGPRGMTLARFFSELYHETIANQLFDVAAQLAYNALLGLFPFIIFLITVLAFLPLKGAADELARLIHEIAPTEAAPLLDQTMRAVVTNRHGRLLAVSLVGSMWAASSGVAALTSALNRAYDTRETRSWFRVRLQSLVITLFSVVMLVVGAVALLVGPGVVEHLAEWFHLGSLPLTLYYWLRWPSIVVVMSLMLAVLYWACPNLHQRFRLLTPGSVVAIPLWIGVSLGFNAYVNTLGSGSINRTYGALGAGVVLMLWIYLSSLIVLLGGEMNAILERASPESTHHEREPHPFRRGHHHEKAGPGR